MKFKIVLFIMTASFLLYFSSCIKKCRNGIATYRYLPQMDSYFGMFKENCWWVYINQDSTKRDSLYIIDFEERIQRDVMDDCLEYPEQTFKLYGRYFTGTQLYFNGFYYNNSGCCENYFNCGIGAKMNSQIHTHPISTSAIPELILNNITVSNVMYNNVLLLEHGSNKAYFAPEKGLVRFVNNKDTFDLIKSK